MSRRSSRDTNPDVPQVPNLEAVLRERIRREGHITFREWMRAALYDEQGGYYRRRGVERWGRAGDYRTSPERSALFAATFAGHFANLFDELDRPPALYILEAGGGAGRFAHGVLQTLRLDAPHVFQSLCYIFDESSEESRTRAATLLAPFAERVEFRSIEEFTKPLEAAIVFSNELLDAFPVHRVVIREGALREMYVGVGEDENFVWVESDPSTPRLAEHFARMDLTLAEGQFAEVNPGAEEWMKSAARIVGRGFVISVDYGDEAERLFGAPHRREGTLRAFRGHELAEDVLREPGEQDLTTTVNWTHVRSVGEAVGLETVTLEQLDSFLLRAGLLEQLERETARAADGADIARLRLNAREMILPGGMASHFQVLVQKKR
ncbi:MAG: SAM-dependent methyltransferase [Rubrivivax sp.]|nr:SAM-dependent methyltransferase [Pyrinomonadaceae bacterium]